MDSYFTEEVSLLIKQLYAIMGLCGSDFTNTFRDLALVTKSIGMEDEDRAALVALSLKNTVPKEGLIASKKSRYTNEETIRKILETQPEMLKFFGLDPSKV